MGIFDIFKNKKEETFSPKPVEADQQVSLENFDFYYLYGLTDNPYRQSNDVKAFAELYRTVIGTKGGILVGSSFHPYQLVNQKRATVWIVAFAQLLVNEKKNEIFNSIMNNNALFLVDPSSSFKNFNIWPDTRLTHEENPVFSKYVPFVIPFLVYKLGQKPNWDIEIEKGMATKGNASDYVETITKLIGFVMPSPSFVLGFDEFDETNPSKLIDNFINCKQLLRQ